MNVTGKRPADIIISLLISIACFLPELDLFDDGCLLPKWYLLIIVSCVLVIRGCTSGVNWVQAREWLQKGLLLSGLVVSGWALAQGLLGNRWPVYGTFDNPAGMALSLCCIMALCWRKTALEKRCVKWGAIAAGIMMATAVIVTYSRIGIATLAILLFVGLWTHRQKVFALITMAVMVSIFVMFMDKKRDSSSGRLFILQRTWEMVEEHPLKGWGIGGFRKHYMLRQAVFFENNADDKAGWLADDVRHPFCEYLLWWVDGGIMGVLALIVLLILPILYAKESSLRVACLVVSIFASASYPLHYPISWIVLGMGWLSILRYKNITYEGSSYVRYPSIALCLILMPVTFLHAYCASVQKRAENAALRHHHTHAIHLYKRVYPLSLYNPYFLYSFSRECYTVGRFSEALRLNEECHRYWNTYDLVLLRADILFRRHDYSKAISNYRLAHNMCPVRFAPLDGLLNTYEAIGDTDMMRQMALQIIDKPIKVPSQAVNHIKSKAREKMNNDSPSITPHKT